MAVNWEKGRRSYSVRRIKEKELRAAGAPAGAGQEGKRKGGKEGKEEGFRSDLGHNHTFLQLGFLYLPLHIQPTCIDLTSEPKASGAQGAALQPSKYGPDGIQDRSLG